MDYDKCHEISILKRIQMKNLVKLQSHKEFNL